MPQHKLNILVTGRTGYVAQNLIPELESLGHTVYTTSRTEINNVENNFSLGNLSSETKWSQVFEGRKIDVVIHLAARVHMMKEKNPNPEKAYLDANYEATKALADESHKAGVEKFIFMSTVGVYDIRSYSFIDERTPKKPHSFYAASKLKAEKYLFDKYSDSKMNVIVVQPPMVYGKNAKGNWGLIVKLAKLPFPLPFKDYNLPKNFIFISNLTNFISFLLDKKINYSDSFLISDQQKTSTYQIIKDIRSASKNRFPIFSLPFLGKFLKAIGLRHIDQKLYRECRINICKALKIGWVPKKMFLEDAVKKSI